MTQAKAQAVASAVIAAGYTAYAYIRSDGSTWAVRAKSTDLNVDVTVAHNLAAQQAVVGLIAEIEYT